MKTQPSRSLTQPSRSLLFPSKPSVPSARASGRISALLVGQGTGIITCGERRDVFFHKTAAAGKFFDLRVGDRVRFELLDDAISGPRAERVRLE